MSKGPTLLVAVLLFSLVAVASPAAAQDQVTLTVSVVDQDGTAIGGATIDANWDGGSTTARTASNGKAFVDVPRGVNVELNVSSDNYVRNSPYTVEGATSEEVTVRVAQKGELTVTATSGGQPLSGVRVTLNKGGDTVVEGRTGEDGTLESGVIEQGRYYVRLHKAGYYRNATYVQVNQSAAASFPMVQGTTNVEFRVVDDHFEEAQPVTGAQIGVEGIGTQRATAGSVTFTVPVNDFYRVSATKDGYATNETRFFVGTDGERRTLVINREEALSVEPSNERIVVGERLTVTVTNAYDEPVEGAAVSLDGEEVATTNADGQARFTIEGAGDHEITAAAGGVTSAAVNVSGVAVDENGNTVTRTATETEGTEPLPLPGFGPAVAVVAVLGAALLLRRRR